MSKIGRGRRAAIATRELDEKTKKAIVGRKGMSDRAYSVVPGMRPLGGSTTSDDWRNARRAKSKRNVLVASFSDRSTVS